jgi:hypothetical protein
LGDFGQLDLDGLHAGSNFQTTGWPLRFAIFSGKESEAENLLTDCRMNTSPHYGKKGILDVTHKALHVLFGPRIVERVGLQNSRNSRDEAKPTVNNLPRETISGSDALKAEVLGQAA